MNQSFCNENNFQTDTSLLLYCHLLFLFSHVTEGKKSFCVYSCGLLGFHRQKGHWMWSEMTYHILTYLLPCLNSVRTSHFVFSRDCNSFI